MSVKANRSQTEYALYTGDRFRAVGTLEEIARCSNIRMETLKFYLTPAYKKRIEERDGESTLLIVLEDCEDL